jgi:hypothetical protein
MDKIKMKLIAEIIDGTIVRDPMGTDRQRLITPSGYMLLIHKGKIFNAGIMSKSEAKRWIDKTK